ncbi:MAG: polyprenyl synthetase family protein [Hyphomicrobiaceae bacterium]|nr:polyprenyl synthetase family protein [Caldilineaceae bacterium]MCB1515733.1 polyprenyl synthetase family protein [Hyphomicrobiaceae bacterium]MCC0008320.1 polyprenyl synthetase family protein [Hyphomicrobiaceae bacterium]
MTFAQKLDQAARATEERLSALLDKLAGPQAASARLSAAMRHALLGGGKRFRPFLVVESAALFGLPITAAIDTACALECVHCYSLAHDDLPAMDNDILRRGQPTVWHAYDEWTAILAGDALLTLAFEILARPSAHADPDVRAELVLELAKASGARGMVGGQSLDLEAEKLATAEPLGIDGIRRLQGMKTGALIRFAASAGAILAKAGADDRDRLARYGDDLGFAFQIADDLLDVEGSEVEVGKAVAKDAQAGKATLVSLMGLEAARSKLRALEQDAKHLMTHYGPRGATLAEAATFVVNRRS